MTAIVLDDPGRESTWKTRSCLLVFAVLFLAISLSSMQQKGATFDESLHIPAGYTYIAFGDFRMNPEHPPLIKILAALPLLWLRPRAETGVVWRTVDPSASDWSQNQWVFGSKFLYDWNDADRVIFWARAPLVALSLLLGLAVHSCARHLYGWKAGIYALALYLFHPDVLAHGQLVTTDMGVAGFMFVAVYVFYRALCRMTPGTVILAGVAAGLAIVTKFSGLLLFPMLILVGGAFALSPVPVALSGFQREPRSISSLRAKLAVALALVAATALLSLVIIWACYGFRYRMSPDPEVSHTLAWTSYLEKPGLVYDVARVIHRRHLVPEGYLYGVLLATSSLSGRQAFLMGHRSVGGWWYYFLVTFLVKTPIPFILLILLGFILIRRYGAGLAAEPFDRVASGSMVAVSATNLQCAYLTDEVVPGIQEFMGRLQHLEPIANIGFSIFIYRMP